MKTFNGDNFVISSKDKLEVGEFLVGTEIFDIYSHRQSPIYYENGIRQIDEKLKEKSYIDLGYVVSIKAKTNAIEIWFYKFINDDTLYDFSVVIIDRENLVSIESFPSTNLRVVKREETKHKVKYMARNSSGLIGALTGKATEKIVSANTELLSGTKYKLKYVDENRQISEFILYSSSEFDSTITLFLNTYYKKILPPEAFIPLHEESNSACYIASACYKDSFAQEVIDFRWYRDNVLAKKLLGRQFVSIYYKISPMLFNPIFKSRIVSKLIKGILGIIHKTIVLKEKKNCL